LFGRTYQQPALPGVSRFCARGSAVADVTHVSAGFWATWLASTGQQGGPAGSGVGPRPISGSLGADREVHAPSRSSTPLHTGGWRSIVRGSAGGPCGGAPLNRKPCRSSRSCVPIVLAALIVPFFVVCRASAIAFWWTHLRRSFSIVSGDAHEDWLIKPLQSISSARGGRGPAEGFSTIPAGQKLWRGIPLSSRSGLLAGLPNDLAGRSTKGGSPRRRHAVAALRC